MNQLPDPEHVVLAGDWHGNSLWVLNYVIPQAAAEFEKLGESRRIIIQLGDFGFRLAPGEPGAAWLYQISQALAEHDMELWWIDGNHEHWPDIQQLLESDNDVLAPDAEPGFPVIPRIKYLPRGTRWTWHGKTWLAVGGAISVDKLLRKEGVSWWPDEEITEAQADAIISAGPADVLLSHDVPDCWFPSNLGTPARAWEPVLPHAREHSRRLGRIALGTGVSRVFHGHYHVLRLDIYDNVRVVGLPEDGYGFNLATVDVREP